MSSAGEIESGGASGAKKVKGEGAESDSKPNPKIGTHNGTFHCDEVLAVFMLKQLPQYKDAEVIRSRDPAVLALCDVVVDVGGVYDHATCRYDHHQRGFDLTMKSLQPKTQSSIKLSSAGLVFAHYGLQVLAEVLAPEGTDAEVVPLIWAKVYEGLVREVDAIDNGVTQCTGETRYQIVTNLSKRVGSLNVNWNRPDQQETDQFYLAYDMVGREFLECVRHYALTWWPARNIVKVALEQRSTATPEEAQVITLDTFCPWAGHLLELEEELKLTPDIKFVLFEDRDGSWRVRPVPLGSASSFELRLPLKEEWRGLRDEELSRVSGIAGCVFVHASGFIGGNATREGAKLMALGSFPSPS